MGDWKGFEALADLDQPAANVLAVQLGRPDLGIVLGQPVRTGGAMLQASEATTGISALVSRSASWAALRTAWSR